MTKLQEKLLKLKELQTEREALHEERRPATLSAEISQPSNPAIPRSKSLMD